MNTTPIDLLTNGYKRSSLRNFKNKKFGIGDSKLNKYLLTLSNRVRNRCWKLIETTAKAIYSSCYYVTRSPNLRYLTKLATNSVTRRVVTKQKSHKDFANYITEGSYTNISA